MPNPLREKWDMKDFRAMAEFALGCVGGARTFQYAVGEPRDILDMALAFEACGCGVTVEMDDFVLSIVRVGSRPAMNISHKAFLA